eukprot:807777_1
MPENTSTADTQQGVPTNPVQQVQSTSYTQTRSQTVDIDTIRYYRKLNENLPTLSSRYPISTPLATLPEESPPTTPVLQVQSSISAKQSPNLNDARDDTNNRYEDSKSDDSGSNSDDDIMKSLRTDVTPGDIPTQYHADLTDDTNSKVTTHNPNPLKSRMPNLSDMSPSIKTPPFKSGVSKIPLNTLPIKKRRKPPLPVNPLKSKSSTTSHTTNTANRPIKPPVRAIQYLSVVRRKPPYHENKENIRISSIENNLENIKTLSETKCKRSPAVTIPTMDSPPRADVKLADYLVPVDKDTIRAELIEKFHEIQKSLDFSDSELNDYCLSALGVVTKVFVHEPSSSPTKYESGGFQTLLTEQPSVQFEYCAPSEKNAVLVEREKEIKVLKDQNVRLKKKNEGAAEFERRARQQSETRVSELERKLDEKTKLVETLQSELVELRAEAGAVTADSSTLAEWEQRTQEAESRASEFERKVETPNGRVATLQDVLASATREASPSTEAPESETRATAEHAVELKSDVDKMKREPELVNEAKAIEDDSNDTRDQRTVTELSENVVQTTKVEKQKVKHKLPVKIMNGRDTNKNTRDRKKNPHSNIRKKKRKNKRNTNKNYTKKNKKKKTQKTVSLKTMRNHQKIGNHVEDGPNDVVKDKKNRGGSHQK